MENELGAARGVPTRVQRLPGVPAAGAVEARAAPRSVLHAPSPTGPEGAGRAE